MTQQNIDLSRIQQINIGATPNDGMGDDLRTAFDKINKGSEAIIESFKDLEDQVLALKAELDILKGL